jgi:hypothetical protein
VPPVAAQSRGTSVGVAARPVLAGCADHPQLLAAASNAPRLGPDQMDMPGSDNWLNAEVKALALRRPVTYARASRRCDRPARIVSDPHSGRSRGTPSKRCGAAKSPRGATFLGRLYRGMEGLGMDLDAHIGSHLEAGRLVLDGINSSPRTAIACWTRRPISNTHRRQALFRNRRAAISLEMSRFEPPTELFFGRSGKPFRLNARSQRPTWARRRRGPVWAGQYCAKPDLLDRWQDGGSRHPHLRF